MVGEGDEVTFPVAPFHLMLAADGAPLPKSSVPTQFSLAMAFTPTGAGNLRAIPVVYQDGADYGRLVSLQVPKGYYSLGPAQADAAIDQEPAIAQQLSLWSRRGVEVVRGHTTTLVVGNEVIYVEPVFLRSTQRPLTHLEQVVVVFRGKARMAETLEGALRKAIAAHKVGVD